MGIVVIISMYLKSDYGMNGALVILLIYILRERPAAQAILSYPLWPGGYAALAAFLPINLYNGQRGFIKSRSAKYAFYLFYPVHMLVLALLRGIIL